jgi:hypothetical protein
MPFGDEFLPFGEKKKRQKNIYLKFSVLKKMPIF